MIKRSPAIAAPTSPKAFWNPKLIPNIPLTLARLAGFNEKNLTFPEIESYNINLRFELDAGQTRTESIASKNGNWIMIEKMASVVFAPQATAPVVTTDLVAVSSYFVSENSGTNITIIEEQPINLVFGTGEWQSAGFPETWNSVNNRIFSVKNKSSYPVVVNLGFKLSRVAPRVIY